MIKVTCKAMKTFSLQYTKYWLKIPIKNPFANLLKVKIEWYTKPKG